MTRLHFARGHDSHYSRNQYSTLNPQYFKFVNILHVIDAFDLNTNQSQRVYDFLANEIVGFIDRISKFQ